jgi:hypothetical protein
MGTNIVKVPIAKGGKDAFIEVNLDAEVMDQEDFALIVMEGLKVILNARMSGDKGPGAITKMAAGSPELAAAHKTAMEIATENHRRLITGELRTKKAGKAKSDIPREVQTEARRLARDLVRNLIREAGGKPSHYAASEITKYADALIASDGTILEKAKENIASRATIVVAKEAIAGIKEDPKKAAEREAAKAEKATQLSSTQAGKPKVPTRKKGDVSLATITAMASQAPAAAQFTAGHHTSH